MDTKKRQPPAPEVCENCHQKIGALETPHVFEGQVVCSQCHAGLTEKSRDLEMPEAQEFRSDGPLNAALVNRLLAVVEPHLADAPQDRQLVEQAVAGDTNSICFIGKEISENPNWPSDPKLALALTVEAANRGHAAALSNLGVDYLHGNNTLPKDEAKAVQLFMKAAEMGNSTGCWWLGVCYKEGTGVAANPVTAAQWFQRGAAAGDMGCLFRLGECYEEGLGLAQDYKQAMVCYRRVASAPPTVADPLDIASAMNYIACLYEFGHGVAQSDTAAAAWMLKAAEAGDAYAMKLIGDWYASGQGVPRSMRNAHYWHTRAVEAEVEQTRELEQMRKET